MSKVAIRRLIIFCVVAAVVALLLWMLQPGPVFYFTLGWVGVIAFLLWIGNRLLTKGLDKVMSWSRFGNIRFFVQLFLALAYLALLINLIYYSIKIMLVGLSPTTEQLIVANGWGIVIFVPVFSIYFSLHFLRHWRQSELEVEKFQKETMRSQLDSLKNHLDPHFLFNNLNILASLIETDQASSKKFIHKFAEVYRILLKSKSDDLVTLDDEMEFIQSYIYLIKTRFEENIRFEIDIAAEAKGKMIPPLTIQMLLENAIKHNAISEKNPLRIGIKHHSDDKLIIWNSLNKSNSVAGSPGTGLANIKQRYAHFTNEPVEVTESNDLFEVQIPLLQIEHL